jgi:hypothetical protein
MSAVTREERRGDELVIVVNLAFAISYSLSYKFASTQE